MGSPSEKAMVSAGGAFYFSGCVVGGAACGEDILNLNNYNKNLTQNRGRYSEKSLNVSKFSWV
jgi:hypothetical protein